MSKKENEPLLGNWGRIKRVPFELRFPQYTIPANSNQWEIKERVIDHPRLLLFYMECKSWKNCVMSHYFLATVLIIFFIPIFGLGVSLIFLLLVLQYVRFNTWKYAVILVNPNNVSQWHGWIRLLEHGNFSNLEVVIQILKKDNRTSFNYKNVSSLFEMDEHDLVKHWKSSNENVEFLIKKMGPLLQMEGTFDFDNILEPEIDIMESENGESIQKSIMAPNGTKRRVPSNLLSVQQSGGDSIALKEKYVSVMKEELEEREKLVALAEENEKKMADLRKKNDSFKSECRKLKLERSKMSISLEEKEEEIRKLKEMLNQKE